MATTYTNMSLKSWNLAADVFSYTDLDANWSKVDTHDHSPDKGIQIPLAGLASNSVDSSKIVNGSITGTDIASATIADSNLTSSVMGVWKTLFQATANVQAGATSSVYWIGQTGAIAISANTQAAPPVAFYSDPADYAVAGKTTQIRVNASMNVNAAGPGQSISAEIRTLTSSGGGAGLFSLTPSGTALSSVTIASGTLVAGANVVSSSTPITHPAAGWLVPVVLPGGVTVASSGVSVNIRVQLRHI